MFGSNGFALASWAARIPQVKARLGLGPAQLGLVLLSIAAGSVIALPLSGPVVSRLGTRLTVAGAAIVCGAGLIVAAVGVGFGVAAVVTGLFAVGVGNGAWDVAMNVQAANVERRLGRAIMARFHAGFSLGTVAGAVSGAAMVAIGVSVSVHLAIVGAAVIVVVPLATRRFLADEHTPAAGAPRRRARDHSRSSLRAWGERRTLLIGVIALAFAFTEGSGNDWISVAMIGSHQVGPAIGALAFAAFLAAETTGRWFGPWLLDRYGRVTVVRGLTGVASAGVLVFAFAPSTPAAFAGAMLWGAGVSLGFPAAMSAGADDPRMAAPRVSVVASIGYCGFLAGPPLIGFLGQRLTVAHALTATIVLLALAGAVAAALRHPDGHPPAP